VDYAIGLLTSTTILLSTILKLHCFLSKTSVWRVPLMRTSSVLVSANSASTCLVDSSLLFIEILLDERLILQKANWTFEDSQLTFFYTAYLLAGYA
jgi:hypothetical protein